MSEQSKTEASTIEADGSFSFMMGEFQAKFPGDRFYVSNHMWAAEKGGGVWLFGLTAYAVRLLQDIYFLDWVIDPPANLKSRQHLGSIESKKAESDLFAPCSGELITFNEALFDDPSLINANPYEEGWMFSMNISEDSQLLQPGEYASHLVKAWDVAQKTIKGQANH